MRITQESLPSSMEAQILTSPGVPGRNRKLTEVPSPLSWSVPRVADIRLAG
jgi:hypothetical protein